MRAPITYKPLGDFNYFYLQSYKEWLLQQSITVNTRRSYHSCVKQFLFFIEYANLNIQTFDDIHNLPEAMNLYLKFLKEIKRTARSINANVNALNNFIHFVGLNGQKLNRERCYYKPAKILTATEQKEFLRSVNNQESKRDKALALIFFFTGLRIGNVARLNIEDILITQEEMNFSNQPNDRTSFACILLKTGNNLPLNKITAIALQNWLTDRNEFCSTTNYITAENALWLTKRGQRLSIPGITYIIKRIGWQAKVLLSPEILRRTWLANANDRLSNEELAAIFGNYISAATVSRYSKTLPNNSDIFPFE